MLTQLHTAIVRRLPVLRGKRPSGDVSRLIGGGAWTLLARIVSQAAQLAAFITAARVLTSSEFGFYAYSSAFALLFVVFAEGGWGEFVMKMGDDRNKLDQIATVSILSGSGAMAIGLCATAVIALFFGQTHEALLIGLFSCWILPSSLSTVYDGILVARGRLRNQSMIRILAEIAGFCAVVFGIWAGWNILSFVAGRLVTQLTSLVASMAVLRWLPRLHLERPFVIELLQFSRHIVANRFIIFLRSYSATLVVGSFLGLAEAGYYRAAERIIAAFSELIGEPARILAWTSLRRAAARGASAGTSSSEIGKSATIIMTVLMTISLPVYVGLAMVSDTVVHFALGPSWAPVAFLVTLLSLKQILLIPGYVTEPLMSLSGTIARMPPTIIANSLVAIGFLLTLAPFGMVAAACGQCAASLVSFCISMRLQSRYGGMDWIRVLHDCAFVMIALVAMATAVFILGDLGEMLSIDRIPIVLVQVTAGAVIYLAALLAVQKFRGVSLTIFDFGNRSLERKTMGKAL